MGGVDWTVFHWINGSAGQHAWLDNVGKVAATQLAFVIAVTIAGGWLLAAGSHVWRERQLPRGLVLVVFTAGMSLALALVANQVIGIAWFRPRPSTSHHQAHLLLGPSPDPSFPSDHATAGFALSLGALKELPRVAVVLFVETLVMSVGRVYVGLHYPGDMVGGLVIAAGAAFVCYWVLHRGARAVDGMVALVNRSVDRLRLPVHLI